MRSRKQQFRAWGITLVLLALMLGASEAFGQNWKNPIANGGESETFSKACKREQKAFTRDTRNLRVKDGKVIVLAFEHALVVHDNEGKEVVLVLSGYGKIRGRGQLKKNEHWAQHDYDCREHRATVEIKEVNDPFDVPFGAPLAWKASSTVCVLINPGFTDKEKEAVYIASEAWNVAGRVKFIRSGNACNLTTTVERYPVLAEGKGKFAALTLQESKNGVLTAVRILIDPKTIKLNALRSFVAHEIGHSLGLADSNGKTVMRPVPGVNSDNGYFGPSKSDLDRLRKAN